MISKEDVKHIAKLSRIELSDKEVKRFQKDLSSVLDYFEMLKEVDTEGVMPTFHSSENYFKENVVRQDRVESGDIADELINAASDKKERYIKVKSVFK